MSDTKLSGYEATEAALGEYERPAEICWDTTPENGKGTNPAAWSHSDWPAGDAS